MRTSSGLLIGTVLIAGSFAAWHFTRPKPEAAPAPPPVPVAAEQARDAKVPVYLRGIGTVTALNEVDIRPQVGGVLESVPVKEGDMVKKGDLIAIIDPRPYQAALDKAKAQLVQDQAQVTNAQADQQRYGALVKSDFASRQQYDTQVSTVARLQGAVAGDQASIESAQINLTYCVLRSPIDGQIGLRRVDPGNLVQANNSTAILSVEQDQPISVIFTLPESDIPALRAAMAKGQLPTKADTSDSARELASGTLLTPNNAVDPASGTIQLRAVFANDDMALTPGQFVNIRLQIDTASGVTVPHDAVQHGTDGLFVFTVKPDNTVASSPVQVAYDDGTQSVISKGVTNGETVITAGQTRIGTGVKVAPHAPGQAPQETPQPQQTAQKDAQK